MTYSILTITNLSEDMTITASLAMFVIVTVAGSTWTISWKLTKLISELKLYGVRLTEMENDNFTKAEAAEQAFRTAMANPGLQIADPRYPDKFISVATSKVQ